jgi:dolichyl-phosphate-mannose--protein O-mannosyl transferase
MKEAVRFLSGITVLLAIGIAVWGWVWNIVKIFEIASDPITGMFLLRLAGLVLVPVGIILGFI